MNAEKILNKCRELRNLPPKLSHRIFKEFGEFLSDMVDFLVFDRESGNQFFRAFQRRIKKEKLDPEKFETYLKLFLEYWKTFSSL